MDSIMLMFNVLIITAYVLLIGFTAPFIMRFFKNRNADIFIQLIPVLSVTLLSSVAMAAGLGGFGELLFFRVITIASAVLLGFLLFLTLMMRILWKDRYDRMVQWMLSLWPRSEKSLSVK